MKVINLSDHTLTPPQLEVLSLGLTFSPTSRFDTFSAVKDLHLFARKLLFKIYYLKNLQTGLTTQEEREALENLESLLREQVSTEPSHFPTTLIPSSTRFPPLSMYSNIETFVKMVTSEFSKISTSVTHDNCTRAQRTAIQDLKKMKDVIFKPSDKGGNVVVWPIKSYEKEVYRQLRDTQCYQRLTFNPTAKYQQELQSILQMAIDRSVLTPKQVDYLTVKEPRIATLYMLPKVHKNLTTPPGRPIVSGNGNLSEPICKFVDYYLQPLVEILPSFIKDTKDILWKLEGMQLEPDMVLVTADVESLYTSIKHDDGINAVQSYLLMSDLDRDLCDVVLECLRFILTHNFFLFKESLFLQLQGTAMGAACAPSYANLFLGLWERGIFCTDPVPYIERVHFWGRYIDDIIFVWQGSIDELTQFMNILNNNKLNIKLTYKTGRTNIDFLDLMLQVNDEGFVHSDLQRKPTATNSLLHAESSHPKHLIRNIPVGQFLRIRRICSTEEYFEKRATELQHRFSERGYNQYDIKRAYSRAKKTLRALLMKDKPLKQSSDNQVRFITPYNCKEKDMRAALQKYWAILTEDEALKGVLPPTPSLTFRRSKNLRDLLVRSHLVGSTPNRLFGSKGPKWGCKPCHSCVACNNVSSMTTFWNSDKSREFTITHTINCQTKAVIYFATCPCGLIYIGMTSRELRRRVREHVLGIQSAATESDIQSLKPIPRHFKSRHNCDPTLLRVWGIDQILPNPRGGNIKKILAQKEAQWIFRLDTVQPKGLNENLSFSSFL